MYPLIYSYGPLTIGSYGIMLGIAFFSGFLIGEREFKIQKINPDLAYVLFLACIPSAIIGAKLFYIIEKFSDFRTDPSGMIFSGSGLTVYGGYISAMAVSFIIVKIYRESVLRVFDAAVPAMLLGYAIGRLGCHAAGDGCYGIKTALIFGTAYPNGIVPVSYEVFPTPLFESFIMLSAFGLILKYRKSILPRGRLFFLYLAFSGTERFFIEFIRLNEKIFFGLTQAQIIGIIFTAAGAAGLLIFRNNYRADTPADEAGAGQPT